MAKGIVHRERPCKPVDSRIMVYVDSITAGQPSGTFYHFNSCQPYPFSDLGDMVIKVDSLLDQLNHPERYLAKRSWKGQDLSIAEPIRLEETPIEFNRSGHMETFSIFVMKRQHGTWQGEVKWVGKNCSVCFRSALELLNLIQAALQDHESPQISMDVT